eukprot:scaffold7706_cov350-Prasinococcus_capsulatus_cf.AAC.2
MLLNEVHIVWLVRLGRLHGPTQLRVNPRKAESAYPHETAAGSSKFPLSHTRCIKSSRRSTTLAKESRKMPDMFMSTSIRGRPPISSRLNNSYLRPAYVVLVPA